MRINTLGETIEKEFAEYYNWMNNDPSMNHFYFDYSM